MNLICDFYGAVNESERQTVINAIKFRESKTYKNCGWVKWEVTYDARKDKFGMCRESWGHPKWFETINEMIHWYMTEGAAL